MADNNITPRDQRRIIQKLARDMIEMDQCLSELLPFFARLQRMCRTSQRLGSRIYRLMKNLEQHRSEMRGRAC